MTWAPPANLATDMEQNPRRHMPTDGHTRKQPTAPTLTTSITREICRTCADRALRKRPPSACHRHRMDTLHRSSDFKATKQPTEEHLGHAGKIRLPKPEPRPKLLSTPSSLPNRNQRPRKGCLSKLCGEDAANHAAKMPPSTGLPVVAGSETMPPRRRKTRRRLHRPIQRI